MKCFSSNAFDACISIAVIHHLSTKERRENAIRELLRIVKPNGLVLIYVWAQEQSKDAQSSENLLENVNSNCRSEEEGKVRKQLSEISGSSSSSIQNQDGGNHVKVEASGVGISDTDVTTSSETCYRKRSNGDMKGEYCNEEETKGFSGECKSSEITARKDDRKKIEVNDARNVFQQQDLLIPWHFRGKQEKRNKSCCNDARTDATSDGEHVYHRFYHVFAEGELEKLCMDIGGNSVIKSYHDKGNWCIILKKV